MSNQSDENCDPSVDSRLLWAVGGQGAAPDSEGGGARALPGTPPSSAAGPKSVILPSATISSASIVVFGSGPAAGPHRAHSRPDRMEVEADHPSTAARAEGGVGDKSSQEWKAADASEEQQLELRYAAYRRRMLFEQVQNAEAYHSAQVRKRAAAIEHSELASEGIIAASKELAAARRMVLVAKQRRDQAQVDLRDAYSKGDSGLVKIKQDLVANSDAELKNAQQEVVSADVTEAKARAGSAEAEQRVANAEAALLRATAEREEAMQEWEVGSGSRTLQSLDNAGTSALGRRTLTLCAQCDFSTFWRSIPIGLISRTRPCSWDFLIGVMQSSYGPSSSKS